MTHILLYLESRRGGGRVWALIPRQCPYFYCPLLSRLRKMERTEPIKVNLAEVQY